MKCSMLSMYAMFQDACGCQNYLPAYSLTSFVAGTKGTMLTGSMNVAAKSLMPMASGIFRSIIIHRLTTTKRIV